MDLEQTAQDFSAKLAETETFETLKEKRKQIRKDEEASGLLSDFEEKQEELQKKQANGNLNRSDLQELKKFSGKWIIISLSKNIERQLANFSRSVRRVFSSCLH